MDVVALAIACVPPIVLLGYVWWIDRLEREPLRLVIAVLAASAVLGTAAAVLIETVGGALLRLSPFVYAPLLYLLVENFVVVALVEEWCKRLPVMRLVWRNPAFDHRFDAIVYCVASAIGFAVAENVVYVEGFGADVALMRLIPVHSICGVYMGFYLACAKRAELAGDAATCAKCRRLSLAVPVLIHGCWDFVMSLGSELLALLALAGIIALTVYAWRRLHLFARFDAPLVQ